MVSNSPLKIEVKEENILGNDYLIAKGRLKGLLKQFTTTNSGSDTDSESSDDREYETRQLEARKRKGPPQGTLVHHTYVMKLFDRSVDLARFEEDTPLYPICRAWMANLPRNPQTIIKRRRSSPEPSTDLWNSTTLTDIYNLPPPTEAFDTRVPSPLGEQFDQGKDTINLNYDENPPLPRDVLIRNHLQRWSKVKKKWIAATRKNEQRYNRSIHILEAIYNKAQEGQE